METLEILDDVEPFQGESLSLTSPVSQPSSGLITTDQARAVAEVQAAMVIARANPRDEHRAYLRIKKACQRKSLAMKAMYAYKRGGSLVEGPSIRLAEVMAMSWTNVNYGFRELSRDRNTSEVEAFAWDLETNTKAVRQFQVRHWRDTKGGGYEIKEERDKYEYIAGMAQRRVRSCILEIIPGDIVESAENECKKTLAKQEEGRTFDDQVRDMIVAFDGMGVTKDMIENRLQHKITALVPQQFYALIKIYNSIKDGVASREEFFNLSPSNGKTLEPDPNAEAKADPYEVQEIKPVVTQDATIAPATDEGPGVESELDEEKALQEAQERLEEKQENTLEKHPCPQCSEILETERKLANHIKKYHTSAPATPPDGDNQERAAAGYADELGLPVFNQILMTPPFNVKSFKDLPESQKPDFLKACSRKLDEGNAE